MDSLKSRILEMIEGCDNQSILLLIASILDNLL